MKICSKKIDHKKTRGTKRIPNEKSFYKIKKYHQCELTSLIISSANIDDEESRKTKRIPSKKFA